MTAQRRRGLVELVFALALMWFTLTAAAGDGFSAEVLTVGFITAVFFSGVGYADVRSKSNAAHRRLDEYRTERQQASEKLDRELAALRAALGELTLTLAREGIGAPRSHGGHDG